MTSPLLDPVKSGRDWRRIGVRVAFAFLLLLPYGVAGWALKDSHNANDRASRALTDAQLATVALRANQIDAICSELSPDEIFASRVTLARELNLDTAALDRVEIEAYDSARRRLNRIKASCAPPLPPPGQTRQPRPPGVP